MNAKDVILLAIFATFAYEAISLSVGNERLILAHVLFRHGNRTPGESETYPNDPHKNYTYYPIGRGELTNAGKRTEYALGLKLRERYGDFLKIYTPPVVYPRSSNFNRTKASLQLVLAGLFPPNGRLEWTTALNWQPIPFYYEAISQDQLFFADLGAGYGENYRKFIQSPNYQKELGKYQLAFRYFEMATGAKVNTLRDVQLFYFCLKTQEEWGLKLPIWTNLVYPGELTKLASLAYLEANANADLLKFTAGPLLKKIVDDSKARIDGVLEPRGRKIFLYSAHEKNVASLLIALGVFRPHVPSYGSHLAVEVYEIGSKHGIKVLYQDETVKLPGCGEICPFERFVEICKSYF